MEDKKEKIIQAIISKAWEDAEFKRDLLLHPKEAIERLTGAEVVLPEGKELIVVDQTDQSKVYVNIPAEPEIRSAELTEEQLEIIAGGGASPQAKMRSEKSLSAETMIRS